jgi:CheY-like chemotaxis protein
MMKKILLVEDDDFLIDIYCKRLEKEGFKVDVAKTGRECLKKLSEGKYHLLLLDLILPEMDGWQVLEEIRKKKEKKEEIVEDLKIVVLSNVMEKEKIDFPFLDGYFIKAHYTPSQLVKKIISLLE